MPLEVPYNLSVRRALLNLQSGTVFHLIENPHSSTQGQCTMLQRFFLNLPADSIIPLEIPYYCNSLDHFTHRNGTSQMQSI